MNNAVKNPLISGNASNANVNNQPNMNNQPNINQLFNSFRKNPVEMLVKAKFNIPENVGNDPQSIGQYLLNSGQISQQQINAAQRYMPFLQRLI